MNIKTFQIANQNIQTYRGRYGITEKKKAELDQLTLEVLETQYEMNECQSIVTSLTNKLNNFQGYLTLAEATRTETLNNKNLMKQLAQSANTLREDSKIAFGEMNTANNKTLALGKGIKQVIDELIYTAEMLNKLGISVTRKKAVNPLISDELISLIATAGTDANSAVALTLVALQSSFAAEASNIEALGAIGLANTQAENLYQTMTNGEDGNESESLKYLYEQAYTQANVHYKYMEKAVAIVVAQLAEANMNLNKAQVNLKSLQAALAAANAAALA